ncbi:MAG: hypothetical protein RIC95_12905 [Vicingaceae bacterium]
MMKRISSFLVALVFILSTSGISVYKHYCGEFLAETSFFHQDNPCEDEEGDGCSMMKMDCCKDDVQFYKLQVDLQKVSPYQLEFSQFTSSILFAVFVPDFSEFDQTNFNCGLDPPELSKPPIYQQNQQLLFYG